MMESFSNPYVYETSCTETKKKIIDNMTCDPMDMDISQINPVTTYRIFQNTLFNNLLHKKIQNDYIYLRELSSKEF